MLLDFGPIYTTTGNIHQIEYAQKCADKGPTCIAIKYKNGIIIAAEKPIDSKLFKSSQRIKRLCPNAFMTYTGLFTDGDCLFYYTKEDVHREMARMEEPINAGSVLYRINSFLSYFNTMYGCRPLGCSFLTGVENKGNYTIYSSEPSARSASVYGGAIGKGMQRAKTELEKLDLTDLSLESAVENCVRILYKSYDPLKDKDFDIEISYLGKESENKIVDVDDETLSKFVEKYKDLSVDE
ncbi:putative proteasome subunit alpha type-7 [Gurleya vavrai]